MKGKLNELIYVVEYSIEQQCWNISRLDDILRINLDMVKRKVSNDYKMIYIGTYEQCEIFIREFNEVWGEICE